MVVTATDGGRPPLSATTTVTLKVGPPGARSVAPLCGQEISVPENTEKGSVVGRVGGPGDQTFSLGGNYSGLFALENGEHMGRFFGKLECRNCYNKLCYYYKSQ